MDSIWQQIMYHSTFLLTPSLGSMTSWFWLETLVLGNLEKQSRKQWPSSYFKATTNFSENCPCLFFHDHLESTKITNHRASTTPIYGNFSNSNCTWQVCAFKHICLSCNHESPVQAGDYHITSHHPPSLQSLVLEHDQTTEWPLFNSKQTLSLEQTCCSVVIQWLPPMELHKIPTHPLATTQ